MTFNYRILIFAEHAALHEVYYDDLGRPTHYTAEPSTFVTPPDDAVDILTALSLALDATPLDAAVFNQPIEQRPVTPRSKTAEPQAPAPLPLALIATDALLAELKLRAERADFFAVIHQVTLSDAIARAETAEAKLAEATAALNSQSMQ